MLKIKIKIVLSQPRFFLDKKFQVDFFRLLHVFTFRSESDKKLNKYEDIRENTVRL